MNSLEIIPAEEYHELDAASASGLKAISRSPAYYQWRKRQPLDGTAILLGSATHTATLEPDLFGQSFRVYDGAVRRGKTWEAFKAEADADRVEVLTKAEAAKVGGMAEAVRAHPLASDLLWRGQAEGSCRWFDPRTGEACKARPDFWTEDGVLVELKTTADPDPRRFVAQSARLLYHLQLAFYADGLEQATGSAPVAVKLIVVGSAPPHDVVVFDVPGIVLEYGRDAYQAALDTLQTCRQTGDWPGIGATEQTLTLPAWATNEDEGPEITSGGVSLF